MVHDRLSAGHGAGLQHVCRGGDVNRIDVMSTIDESRAFVPLNIAVLTISDTRALADDKSGTTLAERLAAAGHRLAAREIVTDDVEAIRVIVKKWIADTGVD